MAEPRPKLRAALIVAVALLHVRVWAREAVSATPQSVAGCYALSIGKWSPTIALGEDSKDVAPPAVVRLFTTPGRGDLEGQGMLVRPARSSRPSIHRGSFWFVEEDRVVVVWTTGFSGLRMSLRPSPTGLEGEAESFWDVDRPPQRAHVDATRVGCGS